MPSNLIVIGVNHDSAPVAVRERVAFAPESVPEAISALIGTTHLNEAIICFVSFFEKSARLLNILSLTSIIV